MGDKMGLQDRLMKKVMSDSMAELGQVLQSIHCHLEIISRELIRTRLELKTSNEINEEEINEIINNYEKNLS